jgi:uncharacterized SAM-binding protein YcdF (DUF218 family)
MRWLRGLLVIVLAAAVGYPLWLAYRVWAQSHDDENHSADAIVVLGAAQYDGEPSPVFRARLEHATYLYEEGFSKTVVVVGGRREGDRFTEAAAGERYLVSRGVPASDILSEGRGTTTLESLRVVKALADRQGIESILAVSDPLHSERIKRIATDLGFTETYTSPASYLVLDRSRATKVRELVHEVGSLLAYELTKRG